MPILLDVTSLATATGQPHGILREEQQLGLHALRAPMPDVAFGVYDREANAYWLLDKGLAQAVLNCEVRLALGSLPPGPAPGRLARLVDRRRAPRPAVDSPGSQTRGKPVLDLRRLSLASADLDRQWLVVSCGLDWETRDMSAFRTLRHRTGFRFCGVCHDLIGVESPHLMPPGYAERFLAYFRCLFEIGDLIIVHSDYVARQVESFVAGQGLVLPRVRRTTLGADALAGTCKDGAVLPAGLVPDRFVLAVGMISPRKNHRLLYLCWDYLLRQAVTEVGDLKLVFAGDPGWLVGDLLTEIDLNPRTHHSILHLRQVSDSTLGALYRNALFTVFPSFDEGFGLPVAEAQSFDKVVLASDQGSIPELFGPSCILASPYDIMGWVKVMRRLATDRTYLEGERTRMRTNRRLISWKESAESFFGHVEELRRGH